MGINGVLGFVECFRANSFCRFCKANAEEAAVMTEEDKSKLRTEENYDQDLKKNNMSETGIKEPCVFHKVKNFHLTQNLSVDMMHDILEGVCVYVMRSIIYSFIFKYKYFTLESLNNRIQNFDFGFTENGNKPPVIQLNRIKNKLNLKISASEMLCLVRYFGLIVGDLIVDKSNESWKLYQHLRQIIDIVTSPRILRSDASELATLIKDLNTLYIKLYGNLKPKFHNLVHYPAILLANGPCINYWCMRFESYHRQLKATAVSTSSSRNLLVTIATKQILQMCDTFHSLEIKNEIQFGSRENFSENNSENEYYKEVEINGNKFKIGMFIVTDLSQIEKEFGKITKIIKVKEEVFFEVSIFQEITFDCHYHAYIVKQNDNETKLFKPADLPLISPVLFVQKDRTQFIATRYRL